MTVSAGVARYADIFKAGAILNTPPSGAQELPRLTPAEQSAASAALAKIGVGSNTSSSGVTASTHSLSSVDTVVVGSGNSTLLGSPAHQPVVTSSSIGTDTVVTGSAIQGSTPVAAGTHSALTLSADTITQAGQTADAFKTTVKPANAVLTMSDKTTINLIGVSSTTPKTH